MNDPRRKRLEQVLRVLEHLQNEVEEVLGEEEEAYENTPETLRKDETYDGIVSLESVRDNLSDALDRLQEVV